MTPEELGPPARLPFPITRALAAPVTTRAQANGMPTMVGHFSTFGDFYEVDSMFEGRFLERVAPGSFTKTIRKSAEGKDPMKVLFDHGADPQIGNKVLGVPTDLREDAIGPAFEVPLFDTAYNRELAPGLEAGAYGSSFRFHVDDDVWDYHPKASDANPDGLPERTITEAKVFEFGPVTFPANPNATAGVRSTTDAFYKRTRDPETFESLLRSAQVARAPQGVTAQSEPPPPDTPLEPPSTDTPERPDEPAPIEDQDPPSGGSPDSRSDSVPDEYVTPEEKVSRVTELKAAIKRQAEETTGVLSVEAQARWDADNKELDTLERDIAAWNERQARVRKLAENDDAHDEARDSRGYPVPNLNFPKADRDVYSPESRATSFEGRMAEYRDDAMRIVEKTHFPSNVADQARSADRIGYLLDHADSPDRELARRLKYTGSPVYLRAFEKIIKAKGSTIGLTPEEQRGTALAVGVDGTGGFTVPFAFDPTVIAIGVNNGAVNPYRRSCRVVSIVGTDTWNALTATAVVATRTTEAAPAIEQGPTFAQPQYIVKRVQGQITASFEMFQDRADLGAEMAALIQEAKDNEEETSWATGAGGATASIGVGPVNGTSGAYTSLTTATSVTLAAADFDAVEAALPVRHRFRAQWFFNRLSIRRAQSLETTGGKLFGGSQYPAVGNPQVDATGNTGLRLLLYPVNESPSLPTAQTANIVIGTLLNVDSYVIVDRVGMSVQFIPFIFGASQGNLVTGQQALYFLYRNHAAPINVDAGRTLRYLT